MFLTVAAPSCLPEINSTPDLPSAERGSALLPAAWQEAMPVVARVGERVGAPVPSNRKTRGKKLRPCPGVHGPCVSRPGKTRLIGRRCYPAGAGQASSVLGAGWASAEPAPFGAGFPGGDR